MLDLYAAVAPAWRRQGLGRALCEPALASGAALRSRVRAEAGGAAFLRTLGFVEASAQAPAGLVRKRSTSAAARAPDPEGRREDEALLHRLANAAWSGAPDAFTSRPDEIAQLVAEQGRLLLFAEAERKPVGYLCGVWLGKTLGIEEIAVLPEFRRMGIARALAARALASAEAAVLSVAEANRPARGLYRLLGFREAARRIVMSATCPLRSRSGWRVRRMMRAWARSSSRATSPPTPGRCRRWWWASGAGPSCADVATKRREATVLVVEHEGRVVGTVAIWKPRSPKSEAWLPNAADLRHLAVEPGLQGKGLSRALLDEAERIAFEEWKVDAICLHVRRGNLGVARLYQARGYRRSPSGIPCSRRSSSTPTCWRELNAAVAERFRPGHPDQPHPAIVALGDGQLQPAEEETVPAWGMAPAVELSSPPSVS